MAGRWAARDGHQRRRATQVAPRLVNEDLRAPALCPPAEARTRYARVLSATSPTTVRMWPNSVFFVSR